MSNQNETVLPQLTEMLEKAAADIKKLEAEAWSAINDDDNMEIHRKKLEQKAVLLVDLMDDAEPFLESLSQEMEDRIWAILMRFSQNASRALELESIFYMANLLYPEDHVDGNPNDLEKLAIELKAKAGPDNKPNDPSDKAGPV